MEVKKYRVKKVIFDEILDKDETQKIIDEYNEYFKRETAKKEGCEVISFIVNEAPYRLEISEEDGGDEIYKDSLEKEVLSNTIVAIWNDFKYKLWKLWN